MRNITIGHLPVDRRSTLREVALAYRRAYHRTKAESRKPESVHHEAYEAAMWEYLRRFEEDKPERLVAANLVSETIAAASNANPKWFWAGPDR